jgi:hypothetical protein
MSFLLPAKIKDKLYRSDDAESKYGNSNALLPTALKGAWFKVNNYIFNKKKINMFLKLLHRVQKM